jgi:histidinol-phosphate/aromatic aminotransferase/cobyric acid decarboxylase-like protein
MQRYHGGRVSPQVIDFSSPSNPLGPPPVVDEILLDSVRGRSYTRYPDYEYKMFREAVAELYNVDPASLVPLNGSAEALQLLIPVLKPRVMVSLEPTFGDHRVQTYSAGVPLVTVPYVIRGFRYEVDPSIYCNLPGEFRAHSLILLSNPNNPTGALTPRRVLEELLSCSKDNTVIVVDEAFSDFTGNKESLLGLGDDRVIVLRSFTKIFSIQGLRVGFLYAGSRRMARLLDGFRQPWNVNSLAVEVTVKLLKWDGLREYLRATMEVVEVERLFLEEHLKRLGFEVYESKAPFLLIRHGVPHPHFNKELLENGLFVRDASTFLYLTPYHSRVSVRLRGDNVRLLEVLEELVKESVLEGVHA